MVKDGSRDIIRAHALSAALRELEDACLAGELGPEDFLHRADGELARLRELLSAAQASQGPESGARLCRVQARELDSFKRQLAAELAVIRTAYAGAQPLPPLGADPLAPGPDAPGDGFGSAAAERLARGAASVGAGSGGLPSALELEDDDRLGPAGPAAAPGAGPAPDLSLDLELDAAPGPASPLRAAERGRGLDTLPDLGLELETEPDAHRKPIRRVILDDDVPVPAQGGGRASAPGLAPGQPAPPWRAAPDRGPEPQPGSGLAFDLEPDTALGQPTLPQGATPDRVSGPDVEPDGGADAFPVPDSFVAQEPAPVRDFAPEATPPSFTPESAPDLAPEAGPEDDPTFGLPPLPAWAPPEHENPGVAQAPRVQPGGTSFGPWTGDDPVPGPLAPGGSCPVSGPGAALLADQEPADDEEPLALGAPVAVAPGLDGHEEVSRPPRGLDLLWDADLPELPDESAPGAEPGPEQDFAGVPTLGRRAGARPAGSQPQAAAGALPQGILRALRHVEAEPDSVSTGASCPLGPRSSGTAGLPSLRRSAPPAPPAPPAPDAAPGLRGSRVPGAEGVPSLRRPAPPAPAPAPATPAACGAPAPPSARRPAPRVQAPVKSKVIVTGCAAWETTDNEMALQMFVPGSQMDLARSASVADDLLGAVGRTPEGDQARQRLARMTRDARQPRKSPGGAAVISLFMAGAGLLYTGSIALGTMLSLVHVVCAAMVFLTQHPLAVGGMGATSLLGAWLAWRQARELNAQELARREAEQQAPVMGARQTHFTERDLHL